MTPDQLGAVLAGVAVNAAKAGLLPATAGARPPTGRMFWPADPRTTDDAPGDRGLTADWVTPVTQRWATALGLWPETLATVLADGLRQHASIEAVAVAPSGLLSLTLSDLARSAIIEAVLRDAARYALGPARLRGSPPLSPPLVAGDVTVRPAQLAHARICRLLRNAEAAGVELHPVTRDTPLTHLTERRLQIVLADLPQRLDAHEGDRPAQTRALIELAGLSDAWRRSLRPETVGAPIEPIHGARVALAAAVRVVLRNGLARLGSAAPERM